jgi:hypothetical protein
MGEMRIMDKEAGDLKVIWDKSVPEEVKVASDQFKALLKKGYNAFKVKKDGEKGGKIEDFDEDIEMMILTPAARKGCIAGILISFNP